MWAKNEKRVHSPLQRRGKQELPLEATFGPEEGKEFTFGKKLKEFQAKRAPSLPPAKKISKSMVRNKSQSAMKRNPSGAISVISESSEKESMASKQTKLSNLREKYGNKRNAKQVTKFKVRPLVPKPEDPIQSMLTK